MVSAFKSIIDTAGAAGGVIAVFIFLLAVIEFINLLIKGIKSICETFGIEFKNKREKKESEDRLNTTITTVEKLATSLDTLSVSLGALQVRNDATDARLDKITLSIDKLATVVDNLQNATVENLYDCINRKCKYYIQLGGIPEDEFDSFNRLTEAYSKCGGNHGLQSRVEYCINSLNIIQSNFTIPHTTTPKK